MDSANLYAWAVPGFLVLMAVEVFWSWRGAKRAYSFADAMTNLACGMGSQVIGLVTVLVQIALYATVFEYARLMTFDASQASTWILAMVGVDFFYYWAHRMGHEVNGLWVFHVVHHQSEHYNLSVALRQSWFGGFVTWIFYMPLALMGIPIGVFATSLAINLLYQFLIHTESVKRLGALEYVLNTPSHHRVHHGSDRLYLDRNYGGILIIWDRFFGSFQEEVSRPRYGLVKPFPVFNALTANFAPVWHLWSETYHLKGWRRRCQLWLRGPGWEPGDRSPVDAIDRALSQGRLELVAAKWTPGFRVVAASFVIAVPITLYLMISGSNGSVLLNGLLAVALGGLFHFWGRRLGTAKMVPPADGKKSARAE